MMTPRGILLDLEGVLYEGEAVVPGAVEAVEALRAMGAGLRFLTNTTVLPRADIAGRLARLGFDAAKAEVFTPPLAARRLIENAGLRRIHLAAEPRLAADFEGFEIVACSPDAVILGDLYRGFDWDRLDALHAMLRSGARLVALHKNRVQRRDGKIALDLGPFVAALEYAAGIEAAVVGKPARTFFEMALADLGVGAAAALMVGDDIEADIGGAQAAGIRAVQVRTGKFTARDLDHGSVIPDARIDSIADLPALVAA